MSVPFNISHPLWIEDPDFDIENHIHRTDGATAGHRCTSSPRSSATSPAGPSTAPGRSGSSGWSKGSRTASVAMVTKMHHAAIDGVTGADLMAHLFDLSADAPPPPPPEEPWHARVVAVATSSSPSMRSGTSSGNPVRMAKVLRRTVRSVVDVVRQQRGAERRRSLAGACRSPRRRSRWTAAITPHRVVAFGKATLDDMRLREVDLRHHGQRRGAGRRARMTLRRYLEAHDDLPDQPLVCSVPGVGARQERERGHQPGVDDVRAPARCSCRTRSRSCARSTRRPRTRR